LIKRLGNGDHRLIKAFIQNKGHFRGQRLRRLKQFVRFYIQGGGKLDQSLGGNPAVAVFDLAEEIDGNIQFFG
jgi:hypothetical protein